VHHRQADVLTGDFEPVACDSRSDCGLANPRHVRFSGSFFLPSQLRPGGAFASLLEVF